MHVMTVNKFKAEKNVEEGKGSLKWFYTPLPHLCRLSHGHFKATLNELSFMPCAKSVTKVLVCIHFGIVQS